VVVVDEAGMVGSRQMDHLLSHIERSGALLRIVGDGKQLPAVEFGNAFQAISDRAPVASLTEIKRQNNDWMRSASESFSRHDIGMALDEYAERGHVTQSETRDDMRAAALKAWMTAREETPEKNTVVICKTNDERQAMNALMREALKQSGALGEDRHIDAGDRTLSLAVGEKIVFMKNEYNDLNVKNGTAGVVDKIEEGGNLHVRLPDGRTVVVDTRKYNSIDYGYALTIYKTQGITAHGAIVMAAAGTTAEDIYVGMTRHKDRCQLLFSAEDFKNFEALKAGCSRSAGKAFSVRADTEWQVAGTAQAVQGDPQREPLQSPIRQKPQSVAGSLHALAEDAHAQAYSEAQADDREIREQLDAARLLKSLSVSHGLKCEAYEIVPGRDGGDRIKVDGKALSVSDFLTKHMHLDWRGEARPFLQACYAQQRQELGQGQRHAPRDALWRDFKASELTAKQRSALRGEQRASERDRFAAIRKDFDKERARIEASTTPTQHRERRAGISVARATKALATAELKALIATEREALDKRFSGKPAERYAGWLAERAREGSTAALAELRRRGFVSPAPQGNHLAGDWRGGRAPMMRKQDGVSYEVSQSGGVLYRENGIEILHDQAQNLEVIQPTARNIEIALHMALSKYGSTLQIGGNEDFKRQVVSVAVQAGVAIKFKDERLQQLYDDGKREPTLPDDQRSESLKQRREAPDDLAESFAQAHGAAVQKDLEAERTRLQKLAEQEEQKQGHRPDSGGTFGP
jgi:hypothetical protein